MSAGRRLLCGLHRCRTGSGAAPAAAPLLVRAAALVAVGIVAGVVAGVAEAQAATIRTPVSYRSWDFEDSLGTATVSQFLAPVHVSLALSPQVSLFLQTGVQHDTAERDSSLSLSGASDTRAALSVTLFDGRLVAHGGVNAPTGLRELDPEAHLVAASLAPPYLGFRQRQPGRGLDLGAGLSVALPLSERFAIGAGAGYVHHGKYTPLEGGGEIRPGAELSFNAGLDARFGSTLLRLDGTRRTYEEDESPGLVYEEPPSWEGSLAVRSGEEGWRFEGLGYVLRKEEASVGLTAYDGWYYGGGLAARRDLGRRLSVGLGVEGVSFRDDEEGAEQFTASALGGGPILFLRPASSVDVELRAFALRGEIDGDDLDGWDFRLTWTVFTGGD